MPSVTHGGATLRYDRAGSGTPVLLVHGWTCNRTFWHRQVQALRDRHTVITVDLRGHGESSRPRAGFTIGAMATDLEALVRTLRVPRIAVVGWSMGGVIAQELARRLGDHVSALALVGTTPGGLADPANPDADPAASAEIQQAVARDFRAFARTLAVTLFREGVEPAHVAWAQSQIQKTPPHVAEACLAAVLAFDARPWLAELQVKTAVLHGRHDHLLPLRGGEYLAKHIPGATLTVFEQSGHSPHLEEPDALNAALAQLLG
ncbi:MAG: alpha/beta hydrolase [Candidatus Binatia bacterium]